MERERYTSNHIVSSTKLYKWTVELRLGTPGCLMQTAAGGAENAYGVPHPLCFSRVRVLTFGRSAIRFVRGAAHAFEVFEGEAELGQHLLVRNALATVKGVASGSDLTGLVLRHRFIVQGSVGQAAGDGIEDSLEQADHGGKLCRAKPVNEFVGVLFGVGYESSSPLILT
jgi:hypothetical protein